MVDSSVLKLEIKRLYRGRWKTAILILIFPLLSFGVSIGYETYSAFVDGNSIDRIIANFDEGMVLTIISVMLLYYLLGFVLLCVSYILSASSDFTLLDWIRTNNPPQDIFKEITQGFKSKYMLGIVKVTFLTALYTLLWSLLFIIPGIIKLFSYSQSIFVYKDMVDHAIENNLPMPKANEAITKSREIMSGYKGNLFVLHLSFLGWFVLVLLTFGVGMIWLLPYMNGTLVNFYHHLNCESEPDL